MDHTKMFHCSPTSTFPSHPLPFPPPQLPQPPHPVTAPLKPRIPHLSTLFLLWLSSYRSLNVHSSLGLML